MNVSITQVQHSEAWPQIMPNFSNEKKKIVKWTNPFTRHYEQNCFWRQEGNFLSAVVVRSWTIILSTQQHNNSFARHTIRKVDWCGLWVQMSLRLVSNWIAATKSRSIDRLTVWDKILVMRIGKYRKKHYLHLLTSLEKSCLWQVQLTIR